MLVENLAINFGAFADTVEVVLALVLMLGGIFLTYKIQVWADRSGDQPAAANTALGGAADRYEGHGIRQ